jgi:HAMP domain.
MFIKLHHYLFGNLRRQLITGMTLTVTLTVGILIWNMTKQQQVAEDEQHVEQIHALADTLATSSVLWVASRDYSGLQETVSVVARYPNLHHVIVLSLEGQVLAHSDPSKVGLYMTDLPSNPKLNTLKKTVSLIDVTKPIMLADQHIGWVRVGIGREAFIAEIAKVRRDGVIYALFAILISVVITTLASRYLTRRLYAIQQVANAVQSGKSSERVVLTGEDEAAVLGGQFNVMLDSLALREEEKRTNDAYMSAILPT